MAAITFSDYSSGLDLRKGASVSDANRLRVLDNCYVTTGKTIRKRPGLTLVTTLETGTQGLRAAGGKLNTFYGSGTIAHADTRFKANKITHPTTGALGVKKIYYADVFNGFLYVAAQYNDNSIKHHYLDGSSPTHIADTNCPNSASVVKKSQKLFSTKDDVVRFCKTSAPRDWTTASDAGFLGVGIQQSGSVNPTALGEYAGNLVVFFKDSSQVWTVDPDPAKMVFQQGMDVGCPYPNGASNMAGDVFFASYDGIRSITTQSTTGNLIDVDVGSPIDSLVKPEFDANADIRAFYFRGGGQYWAMKGSTAYVYSFSRTSKISAWSRYTFPFSINDVTELDGDLYFRSGDSVYKLDESAGTDAGVNFTVTIEFPYLDFKTPGVMKLIQGMDTVMLGSADMQIKFDARNPEFITPTIEMSGDMRPGEMTAVEVCSVGIAPVITCTNAEAFELHAITFYYEDLGNIS
jgi:hypothetical protein